MLENIFTKDRSMSWDCVHSSLFCVFIYSLKFSYIYTVYFGHIHHHPFLFPHSAPTLGAPTPSPSQPHVLHVSLLLSITPESK